ncbi:MAG: translation elongation factor Ts [bacterium]|nr:translation elongation factor Ts [bacterium]
MEIPASLVRELREKTNAGVMECKSALQESKGDLDGAIQILRKRGLALAEKKAQRKVPEGIVASYIHLGGKIGVLVEVNCETDFVARNERFRAFVKDITMHIAAMNPRYIRREDVPPEVIEEQKGNYAAEVADKPPQIVEKIVEGRLNKHFFAEVCLLDQPFIKDPEVTVEQYLKLAIGELRENIVIRRFVRYSMGEDA